DAEHRSARPRRRHPRRDARPRLVGSAEARAQGGGRRQRRAARGGRRLLRLSRLGAAARVRGADLRHRRRSADGDEPRPGALHLAPARGGDHHRPAAGERGAAVDGQAGARSDRRHPARALRRDARGNLHRRRAQRGLRREGEARLHQDHPPVARHHGRRGADDHPRRDRDFGDGLRRQARPGRAGDRPPPDPARLLRPARNRRERGHRRRVPLRAQPGEGAVELAHAGLAPGDAGLRRYDAGLRLLRVELRQLQRDLRRARGGGGAADVALPVGLRPAARRGGKCGARAPDGDGHYRRPAQTDGDPQRLRRGHPARAGL
ncbi:MAG: Inner membrane protein YihY, formerly thought to be RNase BN, partial [uncultured Sphingomonadaceae bacterium]